MWCGTGAAGDSCPSVMPFHVCKKRTHGRRALLPGGTAHPEYVSRSDLAPPPKVIPKLEEVELGLEAVRGWARPGSEANG